MDEDISGIINQISELGSQGLWVPVVSVFIGLVIRLSKSDVTWAFLGKFNIPATVRPWAALGLGLMYGVLQAVIGGTKWVPALIGGLVSAVMAISTHELVIESARNGRDIGVPKDGSGTGGPPIGGKSGRPGAPYSTPMVGLVFLLAVICLTGFDCTKTNGKPVITWPDVVQCTGDPLEIAGDVADVLINDIGGKELSVVGKQKLESLAATKGIPAVLCIVDRLVREWIAPAAAADPNRVAGAMRGESFLRTIGTKVERK